MTEEEIIKFLSNSIDDRKYPYQLSNVFIYGWESDYWFMTEHGETREIEIKISRSDYFADAKKEKHQRDDGANYFYYACPKGLIRPDEVDSRYGLMYVSDTGYVEIVKKPKRLNNNQFKKWKKLASKLYWRYRGLWREKYIKKEITSDEYIAGFSLQLEDNQL